MQSADQMGKGKGSGHWLFLQAVGSVAAERSRTRVQECLLAKLREGLDREALWGWNSMGFNSEVVD